MRRATRRTARRALASAALAALAGTASADYAYPDPANAFPGYSLVVDEGFNTLNYTLFTPDWDCSGWGNGMRAAYTTSPKNLFIKDGVLNLNPVCGRLQPDKSICTPFSGYPECACEPTNYIPIDATAAQISTRNKFAFNQGKFRIRAKMSTGYYTWPAFWLYKESPKGQIAEAGEIDIMEGVGKRPTWWTAVIHYMTKDPATGELKDKVRNNNEDWPTNLNEDYHIYGLDWTAGKFVWTIDETPMWTLDYGKLMSDPNNVNVFDDGLFHIILDVAVGGRMFGIGYGKDKPDYAELCADGSTFTPTQIDWMRVYQESGKQNYRFFSDTPDLVAGSSAGIATQGATCPFDGCIGSSWNDRVAQISGKPVTTAAKLTVATPATTSTKKTTSKSTAISSAAQLAMSTVKPSGASGSASTVFAVAAAALSAVSAVFVALL